MLNALEYKQKQDFLSKLKNKLPRGDQTEIAKRIGKTPQAVSAVLNGAPGAEILKAIIQFLEEKKRMTTDRADKLIKLLED